MVPLRTGLVLGERGGVLGRLSMPYHLFVGGPLGSGTQWFPWIHAVDFVRAVLHVMDRPELQGPVNLVAPQPVTMSELAVALGRVMRRPSWFHVPAFALRAALGEMSETVLVGQKVVPARLERSGFEFNFPTLDGALAEIYRPERQEAIRCPLPRGAPSLCRFFSVHFPSKLCLSPEPPGSDFGRHQQVHRLLPPQEQGSGRRGDQGD